jgi:N-acetyl-gamma-glutamyl-phosphate reductase
VLKVAIIGGSGYTGLELLRLLAMHPSVKVTAVTSRAYKGSPISEFPFLRGFYKGMRFSDPSDLKGIKADIAFSALPHGASQEAVSELLKSSEKVIDLSADFRLHDKAVYATWYGEHKATGLLKDAVYGLPELHRDEIKKARLVANPGCYPTGAILALSPLIKEGLVKDGSIIIDSKSGVSGAGRKASIDTSFVEVASGFKAYKVGSHRHTPEIEQELGSLSGARMKVTFTPHLIPTPRGILTTAYADIKKSVSAGDVLGLYKGFYGKEPFVRVLPEGSFPDISHVRCSNLCDIGVYTDKAKKRAVVISAIDNLVKGASGQAVQNMNIMAGFKETLGLDSPPVGV